MNIRLRRWGGFGVLYAVLILFAVFTLTPILFAVDGSLKPESEIFQVPMRLLPSHIAWQNYVRPFEQANFVRYFENSIVVAVVQTLGPLVLCPMAGYSLAKFSYPGRTIIFIFVLSTIMIPIQVTLVPLFLIVKDLGW
ncbi:MAG: carbohydrate ABC transporter permease, partial [Candidatus Dormiibacterota bacterium]